MTWSTSFPGVVTPACGVTDGAFEVHHDTGRMLRQSSEVRLCFDCGPDGGVYHPDLVGIRWQLRQTTDKKVGRVSIELAMDYLRDLAAKVLDPQFNVFRVHQHHTIPGGKDGPNIVHSHTEGHRAHGHPETAGAWFGHRGKISDPTPAPTGPQLPYVELDPSDLQFRVVIPYQYINPGEHAARVSVGPVATAAERRSARKRMKPPPEWSRATWRASMEATVDVIRYPEYFELQAGGGAIDMTVDRMRDNFGLTPVYVIPGWTPTPYRGLPPWPDEAIA